MTIGGWITLVFTWSFIIALAVYCARKVLILRQAEAEHIKPIYEIDTGDRDNDSRKKE
jgi:hypothetical protein